MSYFESYGFPENKLTNSKLRVIFCHTYSTLIIKFEYSTISRMIYE